MPGRHQPRSGSVAPSAGAGQSCWHGSPPAARRPPRRAANMANHARGHGQAWIEPAAPEAFYGLAGDIVRAIEPHSEADPVGLLLQALVMFGNVVGRCPYFV